MIKHVHLDECDSTQLVLKEQMKQGPQGQFLVSTQKQLQGRGRGERSWECLPGSLCFSMNIEPHPSVSFTALELSVIILKFFEGSKLYLKWPNDIFNTNHKKCCGILVQSANSKFMAGLGINLCSEHPDFGGVFDSIFSFDKKSWSRELAEFILANRIPDVKELKNFWEASCVHMGKIVEISEGDTKTVGHFVGLGDYGEALLSTPEGVKHLYNGSLRIF